MRLDEFASIAKVYINQCIIYMPHMRNLIGASIKHILIFISEDCFSGSFANEFALRRVETLSTSAEILYCHSENDIPIRTILI